MKKQLRSGWQTVIIAAIILTLTLNWDDLPSSVMASRLMDKPVPEMLTEQSAEKEETPQNKIEGAETKEEKKYLDIALSPELQDYTRSVCHNYGVPFELALAVMQTESSYRLNAVNGQSYGLMQVHKINWPRLSDKLGIDDFMEPKNNILAGVYMLSELISKYGEYEAVLLCYNRGEAGAAKCWEKEIFSTAYSEKVLKIYKDFLWQGAHPNQS